MRQEDAAATAYRILQDQEVAARLGLCAADAARLGLALVADADAAPTLAARLLADHAAAIDELERQEMYSTAVPEYDEHGETVMSYVLSEPTRRCLELVAALLAIATDRGRSVRAA